MHTLYSFPFSCSLAVQITLERHQIPYALVDVQRGAGRKVDTDGYGAVNPKRKVPTLILPDGEVLTEIVSVLHYLGGRYAGLDAVGERRRLEWLAFVATELHQQVLGPTFDAATPTAAIADIEVRLLPPVLADLTRALANRGSLLGGPLGVTDSYLLWGLSLVRHRWPDALSVELGRYLAHGMADPAVQRPFAQALRGVSQSPAR